jgi:hypothetical protein
VPLQQQQQQQQQELLPLAQLLQLTSLSVEDFHSPGAAAAVAQATQLCKLRVTGHCTPLSCLQQLTALRGLEFLESFSCVDPLKVDRRTHPPTLLELRNKVSCNLALGPHGWGCGRDSNNSANNRNWDVLLSQSESPVCRLPKHSSRLV